VIPDSLIAEVTRFLKTEKDALSRVADQESEIAALKSANARLHAQLRDLQTRPTFVLVSRASEALDRYPRVKEVLKGIASRLK
jgi:hypothetical protein